MPEARRFVGQQLGGVEDSVAAAAALVTSELVTNAVLHARTAVELGVAQEGGRVLVVVKDRGRGRPEPQPPSTRRTDGRGLVLVESLTARWGVEHLDRGKSVWAVLDRRREDPATTEGGP